MINVQSQYNLYYPKNYYCLPLCRCVFSFCLLAVSIYSFALNNNNNIKFIRVVFVVMYARMRYNIHGINHKIFVFSLSHITIVLLFLYLVSIFLLFLLFLSSFVCVCGLRDSFLFARCDRWINCYNPNIVLDKNTLSFRIHNWFRRPRLCCYTLWSTLKSTVPTAVVVLIPFVVSPCFVLPIYHIFERARARAHTHRNKHTQQSPSICHPMNIQTAVDMQAPSDERYIYNKWVPISLVHNFTDRTPLH